MYITEGSGNGETVLEKLKTETDPQTQLLVFRPPVAMSLLIFYVFAMQCMSTIAVVRRETKSWKWPVLQIVYMSGLAYFCSFIVYTILR